MFAGHKKELEQIRTALAAAENVVIVSHQRPDGDAVGSVIGLGLALEQAGKQVQMVLADGVPGSSKHLPAAERIQQEIHPPVDYTIVVDSSDLERVGPVLPAGFIPDLNIDHHPTNLNYARLNIVLEAAVSTTAVLAHLLPAIGLFIDEPVASALLHGLITDSLGFRTPNMDPLSLRTAADLVEKGADLPELYYQALTRRSYEDARLWGVGLSNLQRKGDLLWTCISLEERKRVGYGGLDDADLINLLPTINGVNVALILLEQPDGHVKISWRSKQGYDISGLAFQFGGGGHRNAAGAMVEGALDEVETRVLKATRSHLSALTPVP
jgi:phosphoesterase RecJ-like protein